MGLIFSPFLDRFRRIRIGFHVDPDPKIVHMDPDPGKIQVTNLRNLQLA